MRFCVASGSTALIFAGAILVDSVRSCDAVLRELDCAAEFDPGIHSRGSCHSSTYGVGYGGWGERQDNCPCSARHLPRWTLALQTQRRRISPHKVRDGNTPKEKLTNGGSQVSKFPVLYPTPRTCRRQQIIPSCGSTKEGRRTRADIQENECWIR